MTVVVDKDESSAAFTALTIVSATFPAFIRLLLAIIYPDCKLFNGSCFWGTLFTDFLFIIIPIELIVTLLNKQCLYFLVIILAIIVFLILTQLCKPRVRATGRNTDFLTIPMKTAPCISYFRAYTNIFTALSILAVDFVIYPTYFLKSRAYGTSLMDTGLGYYLISNAIVSYEARDVVTSKRASLLAALKDTVVFVILGVLRFAVTRATGYHVPFQEYGLHWNFFFTLAVVKCLSTLTYCITPKIMFPFLWLLVILPYQYCLSATSLFSFVFFGFSGSGPRDGFLEANREGIVSSIGFLAVYFCGVQLGRVLFRKRTAMKEWLQCICQMTCIFLIPWTLMLYTGGYIQRPSRKLANISYLFFMVGVSSLLMVEGLVFDVAIIYMKHLKYKTEEKDILKANELDSRCRLLIAVNYNGLLFFVVANLLTGFVNLSLDTRSLSAVAAYAMVTVYMFILSLLFMYLYWKTFSFKAFLWRKRHATKLQTV